MKKLLIVYPFFYPALKAGGPIQSLHALSLSLCKDYDITVLTSCYDGNEKLLNIEEDKLLLTDFGKIYYSSNFSFTFLSKFLTSNLFDIIYLNSFWSSLSIRMIVLLKMRRFSNVFIAPRGEFAKSALGIKRLKKRMYLFIYKRLLHSSNFKFHLTSESECVDCKKLFPLNPYFNISNLKNIDLCDFDIISKEKGFLKLVTISRLSRMKNIAYIIDVLAKVHSSANIICDIFGIPEDEDYAEECIKLVNILPDNVIVNFKGELNHSLVSKTLSGYHFYISPTLGENFGHSIMEAINVGIPVIISDRATFFCELESFNAGYYLSLECKDKYIHVIENLAQMDQQEYENILDNVQTYKKHLIKRITDVTPYLKMFN